MPEETKKEDAVVKDEVDTATEDTITVKKSELAEQIRASVAEAVSAIDKPERPEGLFGMFDDDAEDDADDAERVAARPKPWDQKYRKDTVMFARGLFNPNIMAQYRLMKGMRAVIKGDGTGSSGGDDLLPEEFAALIIADIQKKTIVYPFCRQYPVSERNGKIPTGTLPTIAWTAEAVDLTESSPTFSKDEWAIKKVGGYAKLTREMAEDSGVDLVGYITEEFSRALARERDRAVVAGNGSTQPEGFYNKSGFTSYAIGGAITYDSLVALIYTLPPRWRTNFGRNDPNFPKLVISDANEKAIMKIKDTTGMPIFVKDPNEAGKASILGYDYLNVGSDIGDDILFFGNLYSQWVFRKRGDGILVEFSNEATDASGNSAFLQHETWIKVLERYDAAYVRTESMVKGTGGTSS